MLEELAKAMNETYQTHGQVGALRTSPISDDCVAAMVQAVLERLRNPTEAMIHAGRAMLTHRGCNPLTGDTEAAWQVMIDAALAGSE